MNRPEKVSVGAGGVVGFGTGAVVGKVVLAAVGASGLSASGITSGLAVLGGTMVGGVVAFAVLPAAGTVLGIYGGYKACQWWGRRKREGPTDGDDGLPRM